MRAEGQPYRGFLYVGLMMTTRGPEVIEFNVRFGDPEAQVVLPQVEGPFARALLGAATGRLRECWCLDAQSEIDVSASCSRRVAIRRLRIPAARSPDSTWRPLCPTRSFSTPALASLTGASRRPAAACSPWWDVARATLRPWRPHTPAVGFITFEGMQFRRDIGRKAVVGSVEV